MPPSIYLDVCFSDRSAGRPAEHRQLVFPERGAAGAGLQSGGDPVAERTPLGLRLPRSPAAAGRAHRRHPGYGGRHTG